MESIQYELLKYLYEKNKSNPNTAVSTTNAIRDLKFKINNDKINEITTDLTNKGYIENISLSELGEALLHSHIKINTWGKDFIDKNKLRARTFNFLKSHYIWGSISIIWLIWLIMFIIWLIKPELPIWEIISSIAKKATEFQKYFSPSIE
ncbi:hypothetical protein HOC37_02300 [bacterium]|jgi:hypothetical protein|nr:hypothetical protein [bacterium]MBT3580700.1 hypothetical protein [bacterium]MBT4551798.1 hypothetical protein [bacterium]MBT5988683.1 hypothetical protein [bacterium]MBT7087662.1 hypothetical protein [bacterium]